MNLKTAHILPTLLCMSVIFAFAGKANAGMDDFHADYFFTKTDTSHFPLRDRRGDPYSTTHRRNSFDFSDTSYIKRSVQYDPKTKQYYIIEKIGDTYYRTPTAFSMQDFLQLQGRKDEEELRTGGAGGSVVL